MRIHNSNTWRFLLHLAFIQFKRELQRILNILTCNQKQECLSYVLYNVKYKIWIYILFAFIIMIIIQPDLLQPTKKSQKRKYKTKRLVQAPNSFFMDVKCPGCFQMYVQFFFYILLTL